MINDKLYSIQPSHFCYLFTLVCYLYAVIYSGIKQITSHCGTKTSRRHIPHYQSQSNPKNTGEEKAGTDFYQ